MHCKYIGLRIERNSMKNKYWTEDGRRKTEEKHPTTLLELRSPVFGLRVKKKKLIETKVTAISR